MQNLDLNKPEPPPTTGNIDVWPLVIADMVERDAVGRAKYGVPLRTNNGRRPLVDLYQELLDAVVYCRQEIEEAKSCLRPLAGETADISLRRQLASFLDSIVKDCGVALPACTTVEELVGYWMDDLRETDEQRIERNARRIRDLMATLPPDERLSMARELAKGVG